MTQSSYDTDEPIRHVSDVGEVVLKSTFSGVAATVLAITICSPAGVGGIIGTSVAEGFGLAPDTHDVVSLPSIPAPLSGAELSDIRERLAESMTAIDTMRTITDAEIDHLRQLAALDDEASFAADTTPRQQDVELANLLLRGSEG